jgi:hypothetical protein
MMSDVTDRNAQKSLKASSIDSIPRLSEECFPDPLPL